MVYAEHLWTVYKARYTRPLTLQRQRQRQRQSPPVSLYYIPQANLVTGKRSGLVVLDSQPI